jgi:hypothetical protein
MGTIKNEDIVAYQVDEKLVCAGCYNEAEDGAVSQENILIEADLDRDAETYFCDRCGKEI